MEKLPADLIQDIVSRLPYETMINCKLVCKPWRDILSFIKAGLLFQFGSCNPDMKICYGGEQYDDIDMHGDYSYKDLVEINFHQCVDLEPPLSHMVGSCNGLVCFTVEIGKSPIKYDPVYICNPITGEYVYLPEANYDKGDMVGRLYGGFGYHPATDEYKVVRIYDDYSTRKVQVYTLGSGHGWRDVGNIGYYNLVSNPGVCADGSLHWIVYGPKRVILAFDLAGEEFQFMPLPPLSIIGAHKISLNLLRGCVCVVHQNVDSKFFHIWALEEKKTNSYYRRWSKIFSVPCMWMEVAYKPFAVTKSNQVLMSDKESVFCYDSETRILRKLWDGSPRKIVRAIPHMNSLVSLEALGEKSRRRR